MGMFISTLGALSTFYSDAKQIFSVESRRLQTIRLIAKVPTIAAYAYRHSIGRPYNLPDNDLSYAGNFLNMLFRMTETRYRVNPVLERALDVLFILHADHEQNCSTSAMRNIGSSHADPVFVARRRRGGACMARSTAARTKRSCGCSPKLDRINNVPAFIKRVKGGDGRLMGFGHRVYKSYDPRATIIKRIADLVFEVTGKNPLLEIALELERIALEDDYFVTRKALSERRLLFGADLPGDGIPGRRVPGALRDPAHGRLDRAVGRDAERPRSEDRAPAADLRRSAEADYLSREKRS